LQDWLVALGMPAERIEKQVRADQSEDALTLEVHR
jgi:hypothetical protein